MQQQPKHCIICNQIWPSTCYELGVATYIFRVRCTSSNTAFQCDADLGDKFVLVNEIQVLANSLQSYFGQFRPRTCNHATHSLALSISNLIVRMEDEPEWLSLILIDDVMLAS